MKNVGCYGGTTPPPPTAAGWHRPAADRRDRRRDLAHGLRRRLRRHRRRPDQVERRRTTRNFGSGNNEDQCYQAANTTVGGGTLKHGRQAPDRDRVRHATPTAAATTTSPPAWSRPGPQGGAHEVQVPPGLRRGPDARARAATSTGRRSGSSVPVTGRARAGPPTARSTSPRSTARKPDISESNFHRTGGNIGARNHNVNSPARRSTGLNINPPNPFVAGGTQQLAHLRDQLDRQPARVVHRRGPGPHLQRHVVGRPRGARVRAQHHLEPGDGRQRPALPGPRLHRPASRAAATTTATSSPTSRARWRSTT